MNIERKLNDIERNMIYKMGIFMYLGENENVQFNPFISTVQY